MNVLVAGAGLMGKAVVQDLAKDPDVLKITVIDIDEMKLQDCAAISDKVYTLTVDGSDEKKLKEAIKGHDIVAGSLLHKFSPGLVRAAIQSKVHLVDLVGSKSEIKLAMHKDALSNGVTIIPGFGVAPGLSNMMAGEGLRRLFKPDTVKILVGGIPKHPFPPLNYRVIYALDSMLNASVRQAKIIQEGKLIEVEPLTAIEEINFHGVPPCEAYITDGLSTLAITLPEDYPGLQEVVEKTVRYPGFAEKIRFLEQCGLFSEEEVSIEGVRVSPRKVLKTVLDPILSQGSEQDITLLRVEVSGQESSASSEKVRYTFELIDHYDEKTNTTSMARTTAYTCAIACRLVAQGKVLKQGVIPVERVFTGELYQEMINELHTRGIIITEIKESLA